MLPSDLRITGMASGLDTQSIVTKLMAVEQIPLNKIMQNKQWTQWQQAAYRDVNTKLLDFRNSFQNLRLQSTFQANKIQSSDTSKITATQSGNPSQTNYSITAATLYQPAIPSSVKFSSVDASLTDTTTAFGTGKGFSFTLTDPTTTNNTTIVLTDTDNIQTALSKINAQSQNTHVTASYSAGDKALVFTSNPGYSSIAISSAPTNVLNIANGTVDLNQSTIAGGNQGKASVNGSATINGVNLTLTSNTFAFDGVQFTLNSNITSGAVNITKTPDSDAIFTSIKTFVDKYNEMITTFNGKISETKNKDYPPLLDTQKSSMTDTQITQWETEAKKGVLQNDSIVGKLLTSLRKAIYSTVSDPTAGTVNSNFNSLAKIGITTSTDYHDNGKLVIDEAKLKGLLQTNATDVQTLFTKTYDTGTVSDTTLNSTSKFQNSGVAWRIYDQVNATLKQLVTKAGDPTLQIGGSLLDKSIQDINKQITSWQASLTQKENQYWAKFNAMEQAMQQSNSQSSWLTSQLGTSQSGK
ncbi:flagellar filament capping protein FliD [Ectobacillus sp. sgz5001026]|uniref:flagellar filament capping protein FliD n=1 Tax=Ectobacillus sp. sgz5001026 TaxID=3242473 RepID=UPI0036D25A1C